MKKKLTFLLVLLVIALILTSCSINLVAQNRRPIHKRVALDDNITVQEMAKFLEGKKEHYPLSDEFIEKYQQNGGGYIDYAKKCGLEVDKQKHLPNQKWHFFSSWLQDCLDNNTITWEDDAKKNIYNRLLCPELLLWIYEASDVAPEKVKKAFDAAIQGKVAGTHVSTIAKNMRACVPWEDIASNIKNQNLEPIPATGVNLTPTTMELKIGEMKTVIANPVPSNTTDQPTWLVTEGAENISVTTNQNVVSLKGIKEGFAKVKVTYNASVFSEISITINPKDVIDDIPTSVKYNVIYDLGTRVTAKAFEQTTELFNSLVPVSSDIINSISQMTYMYGGASGGRGDTAWHTGDIIKFGTTSVNGSVTFDLATTVNYVKITGYVYDQNCQIQIGDSNSLDWLDTNQDYKTTIVTCQTMNEVSKEIVESKQTSTIMISFSATKELTISTINNKPLFITSIEFGLEE